MRFYPKCRLFTVKSDKFYIEHIGDAISKIKSYIHEVDFDQFHENSMVYDAVIRQLEIIGEATKQFSKDFIQKHSAIPWKEIAGMRDKLIHQYFGVDFEMVWKTVNTDIPSLQTYLNSIINEN